MRFKVLIQLYKLKQNKNLEVKTFFYKKKILSMYLLVPFQFKHNNKEFGFTNLN